jgi:hypothetical protein
MDARKAIYDRLSAVLMDYENDNADSDDLYQMLVDIQNAWEFTITAELETAAMEIHNEQT